jgi:hypothetical protein
VLNELYAKVHEVKDMRKFRFIHWILLAWIILAVPAASHAQVAIGISVRIGPPPLPVYAQPVCPGPRYIWVPGYWAYGPNGYFWVPGTWALVPEPGLLWTPGYWGWANGFYVWHRGYWGPHVGFYGGINYGFGYTGVGFVGGEWRGGEFFYNRAVTNVNVTVVHNTYINRTVIHNVTVNHVSYNGGVGGIEARPTPEEMAAEHEHHIEPTGEQNQHRDAASRDRSQWASVNHGRPNIAASRRPGQFSGQGVTHARQAGGPYRAADFNHGNNSQSRLANQPNRGMNRGQQAHPAHPNNAGRERNGNNKSHGHPNKPRKGEKDRSPGGRGRGGEF